MIRLALRGLAARRLRTALTALAIVVGVATVMAASTITDTMRAATDSLSTSAYDGTDAVVAKKVAFENEYAIGGRPAVSADVLEQVRAVDGVGTAVGDVLGTARLVDREGEIVGTGPYFGVGFDSTTKGADATSPFRLREGRWATAPGQVVIDAGTAEKSDYAIGDSIRVATAGPTKAYEIVGIAGFGEVKSLGSATFAVFDLETAQQAFGRDGFDDVLVTAAAGVSGAELRKRLTAALPELQVTTAAAQDRFTLDGLSEFVGILRTILLVLGGVAVLVGAFTIANTLSITVAQRTKELALLRAVGAGRRQVMRSVVVEALVTGVAASLVGIPAGIGLAKGLQGLFASFGLDLPSTSLQVSPAGVIGAFLVGTVVTLLASLVPARRATKVSPVAAMRDTATEKHPGRVARVARVVAGVLGRPGEKVAGVSGVLARRNAMRRPGRTMATAAALTIGVALVSTVAIVGNGLKTSSREGVEDLVKANLVVAAHDGFSPVDPAAFTAAASAAGVTKATAIRNEEARAFGEPSGVDGIDPATAGGVMRFDWTEGSDAALTGLDGKEAIVVDTFAEQHGLKVGSSFTVESRSEGELDLTVAAIHHRHPFNPLYLGEVAVASSTFDEFFETKEPRIGFVATNGDEAATKAIEAKLAPYTGVQVQTIDAYNDDQDEMWNSVFGILYVLLALAVLVSLIGIVNTLVLSVIERTRELGMLKAVGMTRRQVRRMVRHESIVTALLGATLGIVIGLTIAAIVTTIFADQGLGFAVPTVQIIVFVVLAVGAGILAAALPARRASRLDPLTALAYE